MNFLRSSFTKGVLVLTVFVTISSAQDSEFSFGPRQTRPSSATTIATTPTSSTSAPANQSVAVENGRTRMARLLAAGRKNDSISARSRAFDPTPFMGQGSTSLETNFLSIQSGGSKFTHTNGDSGNFIINNGVPQGFQPGPSIPVGATGLFSPLNARPGNFPQPGSLPNSCRCEAFADCRDVSAFARSDRPRQDVCQPGAVLCCSGRKPSAVGNPANIIIAQQPQPVLVPVTVATPIVQPNGNFVPAGAVTPNAAIASLLNQDCGRKGGNPLARTFDVTNPRGDAEFGEYPWMAAILKSDLNYVCGGALIEARLVLTAAHCVAKVRGEDLIVRLGEFDVSETTEPPYQDIHVKKVIIHGDYHSGTLRNDIALLVLDQPAVMNSYIRPVCLPPAIDFTAMTCTVSGWGKNSPNGQFSTVLKEVDVPVIERTQCQSMLRNAQELGPIFNLHDSFLCAGQAGKDACAGDGGSPLICKVDGAWRLAGLVSWGIGCGQFPGAYVNVAKFLPWIQGVVRENFQL
ncbi:putative Serine proteinase stubble [Hypsibius exemplaris]|uniref:Serine proteinase stubble n=1 Tax=Hypsibius exemplaris TaxID=2072580 RepID=A0A1W0W9B9_HYPEX|nr:putative Serine proteinase stubble [Hypsibius exemplaris]